MRDGSYWMGVKYDRFCFIYSRVWMNNYRICVVTYRMWVVNYRMRLVNYRLQMAKLRYQEWIVTKMERIGTTELQGKVSMNLRRWMEWMREG